MPGRNRSVALLSGWLLAGAALLPVAAVAGADRPDGKANLALVAKPSTSFVSGHETLDAVNDGFTPRHSDDKSRGAYGNWPRTGPQWVEYEWTKPVRTDRVEVYWFDDSRGVRLPRACRLKTWDGSAWVEVKDARGLGLERNTFNVTTFPEIATQRLRLEFDGRESFSTGLLEWRVLDSGRSPNFPPRVAAGVDRVVVGGGATYLSGHVRDDGKPRPVTLRWRKAKGPGEVAFADAAAAETSATFSAPGEYTLELAADDGEAKAAAALTVRVEREPPLPAESPVETTPWSVSSPFWKPRVKALIVNWIPHCVAKIDDPSVREGGIENFVQARAKLDGKPARHTGAPFANAWVYNTVESMCLAQLVDAGGDPEIRQAQAALRQKLDEWVPKLLGAQESDGYLQTMYTVNGHKRWTNKHDHEGYNAGYFMEAAMAHYVMTGGKDRRLFDAARKLADCWCANVGPAPKRAWYEGHQELEQALVRLARFVEAREGPGTGRKYVALAKFLLDSRKNGEEYDQSHLPVTRQYEAVGHAVRAVYGYSGMADVALETNDRDYWSAVQSLHHSIVNRKYYVTGGVGSGETSEGFGKEFSLPNHAYCESCAGCGQLFFEHKLQRAWHDARHADLFEETLYNAILGGVDLAGQNFTYTNALDASGGRYKWHVCPCCVGNIPRTILQLPTWMYSKGPDTLSINLYLGSEVQVGEVAGTPVRIVQETDYPWHGKVRITVYPKTPKQFTLNLRVPNRQTSELYLTTPPVEGLTSLTVNGETVKAAPERGYVALTRTWKAGDVVELEVPLEVQRVKADERIAATRGRVALRRGPLVYNFEGVDQNIDSVLPPNVPLAAVWDDKLLGGVMVISGKWASGHPLLAVPNYARLNRGGRSIVWIRDQ